MCDTKLTAKEMMLLIYTSSVFHTRALMAHSSMAVLPVYGRKNLMKQL